MGLSRKQRHVRACATGIAVAPCSFDNYHGCPAEACGDAIRLMTNACVGTLHPGEIIKEYLEHHGMTNGELAERTGVAQEIITKICDGTASITSQLATTLPDVFGRPVHFWTNLQFQYDTALLQSLSK